MRGRGVPVRVREAGMYPRHRVCGEFISGVTDEELGGWGLRICWRMRSGIGARCGLMRGGR